MIKKIYIYLKSGGFQEVLNYTFTFIKKLFYYKSETVFLYMEQPEPQKINIIENKNIKFKIIETVSDLESLNFERIKTLDFRNWLNKKSIAIIGFSNNNPVSFTWTHFKSHYLGGSIKIDLSTNKCWTGPTFVNKKYRGLGINKMQKQYQLLNLPNNIKYVLTSANTSNIASIKSSKKLGFKAGVRFVKYYGLLRCKEDNYQFENNGEIIFKFI